MAISYVGSVMHWETYLNRRSRSFVLLDCAHSFLRTSVGSPLSTRLLGKSFSIRSDYCTHR